MLKRIAREPLVHFLVLGALIFSGYQFLADKGSEAPDRIVISQARIAQLSGLFQKAWQRPPTAEELKGLIDAFVKEEVYYREALALGLDKDDTVIRRRLQQKLQFITDATVAAPPSDAELQAYLDKQGDRYALEPIVSFKQVYFNPQSHPQTIEQDIAGALTSLTSSPAADDAALGDATMLPPNVEAVRLREVAQTFGSDFATAVQDAPSGRWSGPVSSSYGLHLIFVSSKQPARIPVLSEVRVSVLRDWTDDKRKADEDAMLLTLKKKYHIEVEPSSSTRGR